MAMRWNRRQFLRRLTALAVAGGMWGMSGCGSRPTATPAEVAPQGAPASAAGAAGGADLAVARGAGADPAELTRRAIAAVGGIERFVKKGDVVLVKPNICNAYHGPEYASTTNPQVVAAIVALCRGAGAREVKVLDYPFGGTPEQAYKISGIAEAVGAAGGSLLPISPVKFVETPVPNGKSMQKWRIYQDALDADVYINVPIAKHHSAAGLTLGLKNVMGVIDRRNALHINLHQGIADLATVIKPALTVVDAVRILTANGPTGGNLNDVKQLDTIIASVDVVSADAYACSFFDRQPETIGYIKAAAELGVGTMDLTGIKIEEVVV